MGSSPSESWEAGAVAGFEKQGPEQVRLLLHGGGLSPSLTQMAARWLAEKDQARLERMDASSVEQIELTRQANQIARQARNAARAALAVATISGRDRQAEAWLVNHSPAWLTNLTTRF